MNYAIAELNRLAIAHWADLAQLSNQLCFICHCSPAGSTSPTKLRLATLKTVQKQLIRSNQRKRQRGEQTRSPLCRDCEKWRPDKTQKVRMLYTPPCRLGPKLYKYPSIVVAMTPQLAYSHSSAFCCQSLHIHCLQPDLPLHQHSSKCWSIDQISLICKQCTKATRMPPRTESPQDPNKGGETSTHRHFTHSHILALPPPCWWLAFTLSVRGHDWLYAPFPAWLSWYDLNSNSRFEQRGFREEARFLSRNGVHICPWCGWNLSWLTCQKAILHTRLRSASQILYRYVWPWPNATLYTPSLPSPSLSANGWAPWYSLFQY